MDKHEQQSAKQTAHAERASQKTVLLVEDMPMIRHLYASVLLRAGYRVLQAHDAITAQALAQTSAVIHLLLTDFHMPGMNGVELAQWFRVQRPLVPVLLVSSDEERIERARALLPWVHSHVKPALPADLIGIVERALDHGSSSAS